jgi:hypothetical protein
MSTWVKFLSDGASTTDDTPGLTRRTLHNAAASFPQPTAIDGGGTIESWRDGRGFSPAEADISILGSAACTLAGPLGLYGERFGKVYLIGLLNNGQDITIQGANVGFAQQVSGVGTFERLLLGGVSGTVTPTAGTITVKATPLAVEDRVP